jgi:hypothetical protein
VQIPILSSRHNLQPAVEFFSTSTLLILPNEYNGTVRLSPPETTCLTTLSMSSV